MTEVIIRNKEILNTLNEFIDEFLSIDGYDDPLYRVHAGEKALYDPEYYCSDEWLKYKLERAETHSGFPEEHYSAGMKHMVMKEKNPEKANKLDILKERMRVDFARDSGASHCALTSYYPPGGFVGWHTNWNAWAYQILFTWSKNGDGYFRYYDKAKDEIVTIQDKPGWQCRHYYFGSKDEPEHHCWHAAYAGDERFTLAYKFWNDGDASFNSTSKSMRDQFIEDIESEV